MLFGSGRAVGQAYECIAGLGFRTSGLGLRV